MRRRNERRHNDRDNTFLSRTAAKTVREFRTQGMEDIVQSAEAVPKRVKLIAESLALFDRFRSGSNLHVKAFEK